jgi:hypothetical protein
MKRIAAITIALLTTVCSAASEPPAETLPKPDIRRAFISFRISPLQWMPEKHYGELLAMFEKHKGVTDEITFFTSFTHPPLPLEEMKRRCNILATRMPQARALGYRAGINILSTIGHHEENLPNSLSGDYTNLTDIDGNLCRGSFCPNAPQVQQYVREVYKMIAAANPDYIWIDDDVRLCGARLGFKSGHSARRLADPGSDRFSHPDFVETRICGGDRRRFFGWPPQPMRDVS